jgi:predicted O-linked N-acetylglucosamine transferase (SPINDLY family)
VSALPEELIARRIASANIDILLDLNGYLRPNRVAITARRPAPIQISYLGWPATTGAPFIDHIVADRFVAPEAAWFVEKPLHLDCYMPTDNSRPEPKPRDREEFGLPQDAVILGSMNNSWKLTSTLMTLWCEILREVPNAVLLQALMEAQSERRLREFMAQQGLADRFIIAPQIAYDEHIDRLGLTDVALDSFPYGGHTTTCDALWAGVPVVTCHGGAFASGVATSLLHAVGLPELSTASLADYKALVLALCRDRQRLDALKLRLREARENAPLFDNRRYTADLEARLLELVG